MVWKTGESGNPGGKKPGTMKDKPYRDALRMEIAALHEGDIWGLACDCGAHLNKCKDGDMAAIKELADRRVRQAGAGIRTVTIRSTSAMQQIGQEPSWSPSSMTPLRAAKELLKRTEAIEKLIAFTEYTFDRYRTAPHHRLIAEQLERVERGEIDRLMLLGPPERHGKSELASKRFPAFYLGRYSRTGSSFRYRLRPN